MKRAPRFIVAFALAAGFARQARAEIPIAQAGGWDFILDGRINTFLSFSTGDGQPPVSGVATWQGIYDYPDANGNIMKTRLRSGFIQNVLRLSFKKQLTSDTVVTGRLATWVGVSETQSKIDYPRLDAREVYFKVEGPWGGALAGRNLSLFGRGAILLDYDIEHEYGLGHPCAVTVAQGGACGHAGHGILFPGYNAGIVYNTPEIAGFQLSVGVFDPSTVSERVYQRTPIPRVEGELTFKVATYFHASVSGQWQRIGHNTILNLNPDSQGVSFSAGGALGPAQLGVAGFAGQGLGIYAAMEDSPLFAADGTFILRHQQGILGLASLAFGDLKIAAGVGVTKILKTASEPTGPIPTDGINFPRQQLGISVGAYQHIKNTIVLALEYFRATTMWNDQVDQSDPTKVIPSPKQTVHFINAGATLVF